MPSTYALHPSSSSVSEGKSGESSTYICENTAKRTSQGRSTEEETNTILPLSPLIPHAKVEDDAGEQATLRDAEEEARDEEAGEVVHEAHEGGDDAPGDGEGGEPQAWRRALEDDVAGDLEEDVADKVHGEAGEVLVAGWREG